MTGPSREASRQPLITKRLILRRPVAADIPALARLTNDPEIARNTAGVVYPYPPLSAWRFLDTIARGSDRRYHAPYLLTLRKNPRHFVGAAGFTIKPGRPPEINYWVARAHRRRGYASEAAAIVIDFLLGHDGMDAVVASCRVTNAASRGVLERLGFRFTGRGMVRSRMAGRKLPTLEFILDRRIWARRNGPSRHHSAVDLT